MHEFLDSLLDELGFNEPWKPVSKPAFWAWPVFYIAFIIYAFRRMADFFLSTAPTWSSTRAATICSAGSALRFAFGEARCCSGWCRFFWPCIFSPNARLPASSSACFSSSRTGSIRQPIWPTRAPWCCRLVTTGDPEFAKHDFNAIFSSLGILDYDTTIAAVVRLWAGAE